MRYIVMGLAVIGYLLMMVEFHNLTRYFGVSHTDMAAGVYLALLAISINVMSIKLIAKSAHQNDVL